MTPPRILCVMRLPPAADGHGGSQRAWWLLRALARAGRVDLLLLHRPEDRDFDGVSLTAVAALTESVAVVRVPGWGALKHRRPWLPWRIARWLDPLLTGSAEAPRLGAPPLAAIAARLPRRDYDLVFAGRLPCAVIVEALMARGWLDARRRVVDLDDLLSVFKRRQVAAGDGSVADRWLLRAEIAAIARAEAWVARWDAVGVCTDADVAHLHRIRPGGNYRRVPNVVDRPALPPPPAGAKLLFVGNLSFPPNVHGLARFVAEAWPRIRAVRPDATLAVVGMRPIAAVRAVIAAADGVMLHADVADTGPFYREADLVVCPVFFGGGTRIKLLEAMAFGRPCVSTTLGAEGLGIVAGRHALIADTMPAFAEAVLAVVAEPLLARRLATAARALQQRNYTPDRLIGAVAAML